MWLFRCRRERGHAMASAHNPDVGYTSVRTRTPVYPGHRTGAGDRVDRCVLRLGHLPHQFPKAKSIPLCLQEGGNLTLHLDW